MSRISPLVRRSCLTTAVLVPLLFFLVWSSEARAESPSTRSLDTIANDYFWALQDRLMRPNFSPRANQAWLTKVGTFERRIAHVKKSKLGPQAKMTLRILQSELKSQREYITGGWIQADINGTDSPMQSIAEAANGEMYHTVTEWKWALATLANSKPFMESYVDNLRAGLASGRVQAREAIESAIASLDVMTSNDPKKNPFLKLEDAMVRSLAGKKQLPALRKQLRAIVAKNVLPSHKALRAFLAREYLPRAGKLGRDRTAYLHHMTRHLGPHHLTPEELHLWGRTEVERLQRELARTARKMNPDARSLVSFMSGFNRRKSNGYASAQDFLDAAKEEVVRARELARQRVPIPRSTVDVQPVAPHQEATVAAQYYPTGPGQGVMEVNTGKLLGDQRRSDLATLTTHEVYSGHHLAAMYAQKQEDHLPMFRTEAANTAFDEGWALYSEQLRDTAGEFTPEERVGFLVNHLWRAARLVVDTGLHTGTMSPGQARDYFRRSTFVSRDVAAAEISRYIDWPGQALAYYVGKKQFVDIRNKVQKMLGPKFDERAFHAKILSFGAIPMHELERAMVSWARRRGAQLGGDRHKVARTLRSRVPSSARSARGARGARQTRQKSSSRWRTRGRFGNQARTRGRVATRVR